MTSNATNTLQSTGLPKAPKVLSVIANTVNLQWQESMRVYAAQISMSKEHEYTTQPTENKYKDRSMTDQAKSMSASLTLLRKEMSSLRQMDSYLLCKLMSLHSAISEYKTQEDDMLLSESSVDLVLEEDDEDYTAIDNEMLRVSVI